MMRRAAVLFVALSAAAFGYVRLNTGETAIVPLQRVDNTAIQFYLNTQIAPGLQSGASGKNVTVVTADSDPQGALLAAIAAWNAVTTANIHFRPIQSTTAGHALDGMMVISLATDAADISAVGGAVAITASSWAPGPANFVNGQLLSCSSNCAYQDGSIVDSDILLSPSTNFSTNGTTSIDLQAVLTHELGHSLGANHTGILGATMFQYAELGERFPSTDDLAFVNSVYPLSTGGAPLGTISGKITLAGAAAPYALLTFIDTSLGTTLGSLSNPDGTYSIQAPPGSYVMYAEPFNSIVQPANLYLQPLDQAFLPTFFGGAANPTQIAVIANNTVTANVAVTGGTPSLTPPYAAFGTAGGSGGITNVSQFAGPVEVSSGQSVDLALIGPGFDQTTTVAVYGLGITAGVVRVDKTETFGGSLSGLPFLRTTLTIPTHQNPGLATIVLTSGGSSLTLSGVLFVGPPQPSFTSANVVNGGSFVSPGQVAPGEIVTIGGQNLGPATAVSYLTPTISVFSSASILSKDMGNTRVLFDGIPAPILYTQAGQVNAIVPYEVAGKTSTKMQVEYEGLASPAVPVAVVATAPGMLQLAGGEALAQNNTDFTVNTASNPVARGNYIDIYGTGEGQTNPAGIDGLGSAAFNGVNRQPVAAVSAMVGGQASPSAAVFTNSVSGLAQIVVQVPSGIPAGVAAVTITIGGVTSPPENIYVK